MTTNEELEILVERLNELQKSIAGVDVAFNVESLVDFTEKMMSATSTIHLFSGAIGGSKTALAQMQKELPMTYQSLQTLNKSFSNFKFGIQNGNYMTGLTEGFKTLQNSMNGVQKGVLGVTAGIGEFSTIKDAVHDIGTETDSLIGNLVEISGSVLGAGTVFSSVFGFPAGLAISGITAVIGALAGVSKAFDEIETERFAESVKNALSNPGGVPIDELTNNVVNSIASIGEQFAVITEKSQELDMAEKNIQDIWLEIETVQTKMDAGVISVGEGTAELSRLFGELAIAAETKFGAMEQTIIAAFGSNGIFRNYAEAVGVDITDGLFAALGVTEDMRGRAVELLNKLASPGIAEGDRIEYYEELLNILGITDDLTVAINDFNAELAGISFEDVIVDGKIDPKILREKLGSIALAVENADAALKEAGDALVADLEKLKEEASSEEDVAAIQMLIDLVPGAIASSKAKIRYEASLFTEEINSELLSGVENIIYQQEEKWKNENPLSRAWLSMTQGIDNEDEFVKQGLEEYKISYMDPISEMIEREMDEIGIEGAGYASQAMEGIMRALFSTEEVQDANGVISLNYILDENWEQILSGATEGVSELMEQKAIEANEGFNKGLRENAHLTEEEVVLWMDEYVTAIVQERLDTNSPSKVMEEFGLNSVLGFNKGIEDNTTLSMIELMIYMDKIVASFNLLYSKMCAVGVNAMHSLYIGLCSQENTLYSKAQLISSNLTRIMNGGVAVDTEIALPELPHYDYMQYQSNLESMDLTSVIEAKVEIAVSNAMLPYLEQIVENTREAANRELSVNIGDREIARANLRGRQQMGLQLIT